MTDFVQYYPVCLSIAHRRCVVAGGGTVAERKVLSLLAAGARVVVISPNLTANLEGLRDDGTLEHLPRSYQKGHLAGGLLAILATDDPDTNLAAAHEARRRKVLVSVVDGPTESDFVLPAVLRRGDLLVSVSTNGSCPAGARYIRDEIAELLTPEHTALVKVMADVRHELSVRRQKASGKVWRSALDCELLTLVRQGSLGKARSMLVERLTGHGGIDDRRS